MAEEVREIETYAAGSAYVLKVRLAILFDLNGTNHGEKIISRYSPLAQW